MSTLDNEAQSIRVFSPEFPYPPRGGSPIVILNQIFDWIDRGKRVELVCWFESDEEIAHLRAEKWLREFPAAVRVTSLREKTQPRATWERVARSLISSDSSSELYYYPDVELPAFSAVDLEVFHYSFAVRWLRRRTPRRTVVYFHNFESELAIENADASTGWRRWLYLRNAKKLALHERELNALADEIWCISPTDFARAQSYGLSRAREKYPVFPHHFPKRISPRGEPIYGFVGAMDFRPNQLSAEWILEEIATRLHTVGGKIEFSGRNASPEFRSRAARFPHVRLLDFQTSLEDFWSRIACLLVPDQGGSGVRIKLLEALWRGVPVICNASAAHRIDPALRSHTLLRIVEDPNDWIAELARFSNQV